MIHEEGSSEIQRPLTILFLPYNCHGPINQCIGMGDVLRRRGHRLVIAVTDAWRGKLSEFGFEEYLIDLSTKSNTQQQTEDFWANYVRDSLPKYRQSTFVQLETYMRPSWEILIDEGKAYQSHIPKILEDVQPDVIVQDHNVCFPALVTTSIPFIRLVSCNPLEIPGTDVPPTYSGLSQHDRTEWHGFRTEYNRVHRSLWEEFNAWVRQLGAPSLPDLQFNCESKYANIYIYPEEADYSPSRPLADTWYRMDSSVRQTDADFHLTLSMQNRPSDCSLIYVSLGTLGCADIALMQRLVGVLSLSRHYFIISKGPLGEQLTLNDRMVGEPTLPQTKVIPLVDLVITHGGNNTVTEALHFGKPMVLLPILWDQHDNAQRMHDLGLGLRLNTYRFTDEELLGAIEQLLNDSVLKDRITQLGERIRERDGLRFGADVVERIGREYERKTNTLC